MALHCMACAARMVQQRVGNELQLHAAPAAQLSSHAHHVDCWAAEQTAPGDETKTWVKWVWLWLATRAHSIIACENVLLVLF